MSVDKFLREFPMHAIRCQVGISTTVQYHGNAYSFLKIGPGCFVKV